MCVITNLPTRIKIVSFDIFDTLIVRPYIKPKDLFSHISNICANPRFKEARISAEINARNKKEKKYESREVTLDEIYAELDTNFNNLKAQELALEQNCVAYIPILETYNRLKEQGIRLILCSDMYLPSSFLKKILNDVGIDGFEKIYVSCENNCGKNSGKLFLKIFQDLNIQPDEMIHIGDNLYSDKKIPEKLGIHSILVPKLYEQYFKTHKREKRFYKKNQTLQASMITAMDAIHWMHNDFKIPDTWKEISYRFGGPATYDYCRFIHDNVTNEFLIFIARDGYNLQRIYQQLYAEKQKTAYIHAPRLANILAGNRYEDYRNYKNILIQKLYNNPNLTESEVNVFYDRHSDEISDMRAQIKNSLKCKIKEKIDNSKEMSVIDVTTLKYSSQTLISELLEKRKIKGIYYFILNDRKDLPHTGYTTRNKIWKIGENVNLLEFFMTAPEPPVDNIDLEGNLIFKQPSDNEKIRLNIYDDVTNGELEYAETIKSVFKNNLPSFNRETISKWIKILANTYDTKLRTMLTDMKWPVDSDHQKYVSLVYHPRDTYYHLRKNVLDMMWYISTLIKK